MKLKGEYKIELRDALTGKLKDERKGHNFVTDFWTAVQSKGYGGRQALSAWNLDSMFGGIMCFNQKINETADFTGRLSHPIFAPASKIMVANGCINYSESSAVATELGAYNATDSRANTGTSRRYVYDWDTQEGNGDIACVCLTSNQSGWKGVGNATSGSGISADTGSVGYEFYDYQRRGTVLNFPLGNNNNVNRFAYIRGNKVGVLWSIDDVTATSIKIREYDLPSTIINPFNGMGNYFTYARYTEKTYTLGNYGIDPGNTNVSVGCRAGYWYVIRKLNANMASIHIDIFNNDGTHEDYGFSIPSGTDPRQGNGIQWGGVIKKGNYLFLTTAYNYSNGSNLWLWQYNIATQEFTSPVYTTDGAYGHNYKLGMVELEDVIYNDDFVIRMNAGIPQVTMRNRTKFTNDIYGNQGQGKYMQDLDDPYKIWCEKPASGADAFFGAVGLPSCWLSTIANLSTPVEKRADKTMKITYTLTLVED